MLGLRSLLRLKIFLPLLLVRLLLFRVVPCCALCIYVRERIALLQHSEDYKQGFQFPSVKGTLFGEGSVVLFAAIGAPTAIRSAPLSLARFLVVAYSATGLAAQG